MSKPWEIDELNFNDLKDLDPQDVISRTGSSYDKATRQYKVKIWGDEYCVDLKENKIFPVDTGLKTYQDFLYIFILHYLIKAENTVPSGEWISEKDLPGGEGFFRGPHLLPVDAITKRIGDDIELFNRFCRKTGGRKLDFADAAYAFEITPSVPVAVLYWIGDEEFPSEAKLLFDKTIEQFALDITFALAVEICHAFSYID